MGDTVLLIGGELCERSASCLASSRWSLRGLRRRAVNDTLIDWMQADLRDVRSLRGIGRDISHVLYAPAPPRRDRESYEATYPAGLRNLLDVLDNSRVQRLVLVGSSVVWPASDADDAMAWVDENTPTQAGNFRSAAMLAAESLLHERLPGRGVALRLAGLYGRGRTQLIDGLREGRIAAPEGAGHWSNRLHIDDAARACAHLLGLQDAATCYIGSDGNPTETAAFYDQLADLLGVARPMRRDMAPSGKRLSNARLRASGWTPQWPDALTGYRNLLRGQSDRVT